MKSRGLPWSLPAGLLIVIALAAPASAQLESVERMRDLVAWLAHPDREGRGAGSAGLESSAEHLEELWSKWGKVGVETFETPDGVTLRNLVLRFPPAEGEPEWIVVGAHYDHLGVGGDDDPHRGRVYPGADDNASGVAVVTEMARVVAERGAPERGALFVLFSGEEIGLHGSQAFLAADPERAARVSAMLNFDTVGRPDPEGFTVFGVESARSFRRSLEGLNSAFGLELALAERSTGGSDERSFLEQGIPALHFFSGAHADYHRPSDLPDRLDYQAMDRLAEFGVELVEYLGRRDTRIEYVPAGSQDVTPDPSRATEGRRRVSFGSIPDFKYQEEGVLLSGVLPGSPAALAGLEKGDVILGFGGDVVGDLTDYSEAMKRFAPGDVVAVQFRRGDETLEVEVTLVERK